MLSPQTYKNQFKRPQALTDLVGAFLYPKTGGIRMSEQVRPVDEAEAIDLMQQMTDRNVAAEEDVK